MRRGVTGHVLHGLGGVGKTALALRYAHAHCAEYRLVWWVSAETESLLADGVSGLAARLASVPQSLVDGYSWAIGWLQSHRGWLLVLDNVEDPERLRGLLGAVQGRGRVLATTRRNLAAPVWAQLGLVPLRLDVLDRAASVRLLLGLTGRVGDEDGAALLAAELGDMPLALEQAGAFIAQEGWSFVRYRRELLASPGRTYSAVAEGTEARPVVGRVWSVAVERAVHRAPMAEWVLSVLAWLAPAPLPVSLLVDGGDDADAVTQAVRLLASYSLLTRSAGTVEVHRLVQAATRAHDRDRQQHQRFDDHHRPGDRCDRRRAAGARHRHHPRGQHAGRRRSRDLQLAAAHGCPGAGALCGYRRERRPDPESVRRRGRQLHLAGERAEPRHADAGRDGGRGRDHDGGLRVLSSGTQQKGLPVRQALFASGPGLGNRPGRPQLWGMNTTASKNLVMLARMLERLDRSAVAVDPQQYRGVVEHLSELLLSVPHDAALEAVLAASPATAELYENLQYQHAGLCRAPLEAALDAELAARAAIDAARKAPAQPKA